MGRLGRLAMDLGFSGWLWHRYEVWICAPTPRGAWAMRDYYDNAGRKFTRRGALRFAWSISSTPPYRIELVNLGSGKHEVVRAFLPPEPAQLDELFDRVVTRIDAERPDERWFRSRRYQQGYEDCREVAAQALHSYVEGAR